MSEQDVQTLRGAYQDFNSGNVPGVLAILDQEVEWVEPGGGNAASGTFTGPEAVGNEVFALIPQNFDEFTCEPVEVRDEGDRVVASVRFKGRNKSGAELDASAEHIWEMEGGKVKRFEHKVDEAWAAGWS